MRVYIHTGRIFNVLYCGVVVFMRPTPENSVAQKCMSVEWCVHTRIRIYKSVYSHTRVYTYTCKVYTRRAFRYIYIYCTRLFYCNA